MIDYYVLMNGITTEKINFAIGLFDAFTDEFWEYAMDYSKGHNILDYERINEEIITELYSYPSCDIDICSNGKRLVVKRLGDVLQSIEISNSDTGKVLFSHKRTNKGKE